MQIELQLLLIGHTHTHTHADQLAGAARVWGTLTGGSRTGGEGEVGTAERFIYVAHFAAGIALTVLRASRA